MRAFIEKRATGTPLSIRATRLLCPRCRFHACQAGVESHHYLERHLGKAGGTGSVPFLNLAKIRASSFRLKRRQRAVDTRKHLLFSEHLEELVQTGPRVAASYCEPGRMHDGTDLDTEFCRRCLHGG